MNCDKTLELLSAELDGRLSDAEHAEFARPIWTNVRTAAGSMGRCGCGRDAAETQLEPPKARLTR